MGKLYMQINKSIIVQQTFDQFQQYNRMKNLSPDIIFLLCLLLRDDAEYNVGRTLVDVTKNFQHFDAFFPQIFLHGRKAVDLNKS